eukprot:gene18382-24850_t
MSQMLQQNTRLGSWHPSSSRKANGVGVLSKRPTTSHPSSRLDSRSLTPTHRSRSSSDSTLSSLVPTVATVDNPQTEAAQAADSAPFIWARQWWPVSPTNFLHEDKPNAATIIGKDLVIWHSKEQGWVVMEDRCPHRLAPLSEGRIINDNLACSYHGWQFGADGKCQNIPQLKDCSKALCSTRSCALTYPSKVVDGLLFAFLDTSPEGISHSQASEPFIPEEAISNGGFWFMFQNYNDTIHMLEQTLDPTHGNFLHHRMSGTLGIDKHVVMESSHVGEVSLTKGFVWEHRGYSKSNKDMKARRSFSPPCTTMAKYENPGGPGLVAVIHVVPVVPGTCRTISKFVFLPQPSAATSDAGKEESNEDKADAGKGGSDAGKDPRANSSPAKNKFSLLGLIQGFVFKQPHWLYMDFGLSHQDAVILHRQEHIMRRKGLTDTSYTLFAKEADEGIGAINRWFRLAGYKAMWEREAFKGVPIPQARERTDAELTDPGNAHVQFCKICQEGKKTVTKLCYVVAAATALLFMTSIAAALGKKTVTKGKKTVTKVCYVAAAATALLFMTSIAAALVALFTTAGAPAIPKIWTVCVGTLAGGIVSALATLKLVDFRERRFISGYNMWQKRGGLSLVGVKK